MGKHPMRIVWIVAIAVAVAALVMACAVCGMHAEHDEHCHCPLCVAWHALSLGLPALLALAVLLLRVRRHLVCTRAVHTADTPVVLAVKLNC